MVRVAFGFAFVLHVRQLVQHVSRCYESCERFSIALCPRNYGWFRSAFPSAGNRPYPTGTLSNIGSEGNFWSSVVLGTLGYRSLFYGLGVGITEAGRTNSFPLRCVQEIADRSEDFPSAGNRHFSTGALTNVGSEGNIWVSTLSGTTGYRLIFCGPTICGAEAGRTNGFPLRCVQAFADYSGTSRLRVFGSIRRER